MKNLIRNHTALFPEIVDTCRDNNTFLYLKNSFELDRYYRVLISLYPLTDVRLLSLTLNIKDSIDSLWRNHGAKYTVEYLKECSRLLQFFVANNPQPSTSRLVGATGGLPIIIPAYHRVLIRELHNNNPVKKHRDLQNVIRIILALLGCYRLIRYEGVLKLETITDPTESKGLNPWEVGYVISTKFKSIFDKTKIPVYSHNLLSLATAGPNNKISILSAPLDALALRGRDILNDLSKLSNYFNSGVYPLLLKEFEVLSEVSGKEQLLLGKLSIKEEPAGKRRVFAIVDIWTQSVLKPMHDHVFSILKLIKQDGAFNQIRPVLDLIKSNKGLKTFCYDLSAATDRFPISVQVDLLSQLYNREVAESWKQLLVNRPYYLKETNKSYTYGTGQPMGALSSWGVFSLAHHLIVQIAATRVGIKDWFTEYALLGDDIVITNELVAMEYYKIMTQELYVSINKSKSLESKHGVMEFAKRIIGPSGDLSPVGPKNISLVLANKLHLPSLLVDLKEKGASIDYFFADKLLTIWKKTKLFNFTWIERESLLWSLCKPFGFLDTYTFQPIKWIKKFSKQEVSGNLYKLLQFIEEEWSLERDVALKTCKEAIDKYEGWYKLHDHLINTNAIPSLSEQKLKLIEEYARISNLVFPKVMIDVIRPRMTSSYNMMETLWDNSYAAPTFDTLEVDIRCRLTGRLISTKSFEIVKHEYVLSQFIHYLSANLPQVTPVTSIFDDNNIKQRSLRHVSYRFLKKFLKWMDRNA